MLINDIGDQYQGGERKKIHSPQYSEMEYEFFDSLLYRVVGLDDPVQEVGVQDHSYGNY